MYTDQLYYVCRMTQYHRKKEERRKKKEKRRKKKEERRKKKEEKRRRRKKKKKEGVPLSHANPHSFLVSREFFRGDDQFG